MPWELPASVLDNTAPASIRVAAKPPRRRDEEQVTRTSTEQRQREGRHKAVYTLTRWSQETLGEVVADSGVPRLEGLLAHLRAASWGQAFPLANTQLRLNRSIEVGLSFATYPDSYDDLRPTVLVGIWHLSPSTCVALSLLLPIPVTTMNDVTNIPPFALDQAARAVYVEDSSSTRTDTFKYVRSYGAVRLTGRLAISLIGVAERICGEADIPCVVRKPVSVHLGSSRLMYTVKCGTSVRLCTLTIHSLEMLAHLCRTRGDTIFDELISLAIYASLPDTAAERNTPTYRAYLNACVRISADGSIRYLGKPEGVRPAFEKLHSILALPMRDVATATDFIASLRCVSALAF